MAFYMVWNQAGRAPTFKHTSEGAARLEAARLARETPGQQFHILAAIASVECPLAPLFWEDQTTATGTVNNQCDTATPVRDDIPF